MSGATIRAAAAKVVDSVVTGGRSLDQALAETERPIAASERPLLNELAFGTLRRHFRLRAWIAALLEKPLKPKDRVIESLLAVGLYQLSSLRVPDHAAVTLTVDATRALRRPKYAGLVNAIMRNFRRLNVGEREPGNDEERYDHPAWLIGRLQRDWPDHWRGILEANDERAPMWLRVNSARLTTDEYLTKLQASESIPAITASRLPGFDQAIRLEPPRPAAALPGFADGLVSVQDAGAQLAAPWLLEDGGQTVLDACAAPGGKSGHLLELCESARLGAALTAVDRDPGRLAAAAANLRRLGFSATLAAADASIPEEWWDGRPFDRILLDAPCSATGVVRRHPDIKLLRRESDIAGLAARQRRLLGALWPLLAPGGRLLYVTCSVLSEENEGVVGAFLSDCETAHEDQVLPNYNIRDLMCRKAVGFQILPGESDLDGFYYAGLEKANVT